MSLGGGNLHQKSRRLQTKDRSHSEAAVFTGTFDLTKADAYVISSAEIYSWKKKKSQDGTIYAVYCIHVALKSGLKWIVERRYSQFRELRKEINQLRPDLKVLVFPKKNWFFNLSKAALTHRLSQLNQYINALVALTPQLLEIAIFLEVQMRAAQLKKDPTGAKSGGRIGGKTDGVKRSLSFGALQGSVSIHDFHLLKVLGRGSFGKVFLVRPVRGSQSEVYAMKVLKKSEIIRRQQLEHTLTERFVLATIRNPFILSLHHAFQTSDKLFLVTDYCPGGELFFHLKRLRRFTEGMVRFYSAEISSALAHLHSHGIVYRDLKPENILLDRKGHVTLTDFGLARRLSITPSTQSAGSRARQELTFCGTPEYLSPEMILHRRTRCGYDYLVDWWALGVVCFELLTGLPPFYDRDFQKMCDKILYRPLSFPASTVSRTGTGSSTGLTRSAEDLIRGLLQREPGRRLRFIESDGITDASLAVQQQFMLQRHSFYEQTDWERIVTGHAEPPYAPARPRDTTDTCNFDSEFTKLPVRYSDSPVDEASSTTLSPADQRLFDGFSFSIQSEQDETGSLRDSISSVSSSRTV
jgi:serine/threonine protein kinase